MATNTRLPPPPLANGIVTAPPTAGGNRKKQKRRAKQAAKGASSVPPPGQDGGPTPDQEFEEDPIAYGDEDLDFGDADLDEYHDQYMSPHGGANGVSPPPLSVGGKKGKKKKKGGIGQHSLYDANMLPPLPNPPPPPSNAMRTTHSGGHGHGDIWNTNTQQERQNIKDFWLSLSEDERKSLLKIEKEAVLKKMKQQQKHSCSCTVCGRKRTAIEEELEVLYEGYYEELEQYAHHDHPPLPSADGMLPEPLQHRPPHPLAAPPPNPLHKTSQLREHLEEEDYSDEEEYSDEEDEYSDEDIPELPRGGVPDFFNFGQNLTVKGILTPWLEKLQNGLKGNADNLLTVADDLLKNDGRKFIEMMEQLAERRMQRESEAEYAAANPSHPGAYPPSDPAYNHEDPLAAGDEFDDDEGSYDSQDDYDEELDEEDEMGGLTEEQRMQEGRRMFQIFAARMFEQRVLTAYREKVAAERQQKLLEELEDESKLTAEREAKKQRDAQKKKEKKKQQQQAKAEEKARKDAEKAAEEARIREAEEKKQEEQRRKKDEQRRRKEEEKRRQDEERARKEAEKTRRQQEEQQRREEVERRAREQKAAEKAKKEELRKRERDEREAREKDMMDKKAEQDKEKKEREAKDRAEQEAKQREKTAQQAAQPAQSQQHPQIQKRPSQMGMVAVPGVYPKQTPSGISSPYSSIATPAMPKAPTPATKPRQTSQHGSHASSPKQAQSQVSSLPSKSSSPGSVGAQQQQQQQPLGQPKQIMQKPSNPQQGPQHPTQTTSPMHQQPIQQPPGMLPPPQQYQAGFGGVPPMGLSSFQGLHGPMMHGNMGQRGPLPLYQQSQGPPMGVPNRVHFGPGINGMPPPPGMAPPQSRALAYPYEAPNAGQPPPGFGQQYQPNHTPPLGLPPLQTAPGNDLPRHGLATHSRQQSIDKERFESAANQPIARPAPIQRPSSVKPHSQERRGSNTDLDDLSRALGSSALLADDDEPLPSNPSDSRHQSNIPPGRNGPPSSIGPIGGFGSQVGGPAAPGSNWNVPFGQSTGPGPQNWGGLPTPGVGWPQNQSAFAANSAFGAIGGGQIHRPPTVGGNRPLNVRRAVCQACTQLSMAARGEGDGYHGVDILLRQIESNRALLDPQPSLREIEEICETEGDSQNGGGELHVRRSDAGDMFFVKFEETAATPDQARGHIGLGEIGSPMPSKTSPAGFGAPGMGRTGGFQSLGAVGSSPSF